MANYYYSIGPYVWRTVDDDGWWGHPENTVGAVDLGSLTDQATTPGTERPMGFFATSTDPGSSYTVFGQGDLRELSATGLIRSAWESSTGYAPSGSFLVDLLVDHLTNGSDPEGSAACLPLIPTTQGNLEVWLQGHSKIYTRPFVFGSDPHTNKLKALIQKDLIAIRDSAIKGETRNSRGQVDADHHRRVIDFVCEKYKIDFESIRPASWPAREGRIKHETTISETFNTADSDTLGPNLTWTELSGDADIVSNRWAGITTSTIDRADSDLSGTDVYCEMTIVTRGTSTIDSIARGVGALCRKDSTATQTYYLAYIPTNAATSVARLGRFVTGTLTQLGSDTAITISLPQVIRVTANGSTIQTDWNGVNVISVTDSTITTGLRCGIRAQWNSTAATTIDDWTASDIAVGGDTIRRFMLLGMGQ